MIGQTPYRNYVYAKTKVSLRNDKRAFRDLIHLCPDWISSIRIGGNYLCWNDGVILSARTLESAVDWPKALRPALDLFANWAIVDDKANIAEMMNQGPIGTFLYADKGVSSADAFAQIFVRFSPKDRNRERTSDLIRTAFRSPCTPIFHFDDGKIYFVKTSEPYRTILRRFERASIQLQFFAGIDSEGKRWALHSKMSLQTVGEHTFLG